VLLSKPTLVLEYEAVAKRQARELGLTLADVDDVLDYICSVADHRAIFYLWRPFLSDPTDDLLLELAVEAGAEYIVTHNIRDFTGADRFGVTPIRPGDFLRRIRMIP
jgi:predicted nucleic acid-binding protein